MNLVEGVLETNNMSPESVLMLLEMQQLIRVARPGFWATQIWFYMLPLGGHDVLGHWPFWIGVLYVTFPLSLLLYGWNDAVDYETDQLNLRKGSYLFGARCSKEELKRIPWMIVWIQLPFFTFFVWNIGIVFWVWVLAVVVVNTTYNVLPFACKSRPFFDLANQVGYLFFLLWAQADLPCMPWSGKNVFLRFSR